MKNRCVVRVILIVNALVALIVHYGYVELRDQATYKDGEYIPSEYALIKLAGAVLMSMNEQRITGSRYLRIEDLHAM